MGLLFPAMGVRFLFVSLYFSFLAFHFALARWSAPTGGVAFFVNPQCGLLENTKAHYSLTITLAGVATSRFHWRRYANQSLAEW